MIHLINDIYAIELTTLGDQFKSLRILGPDKKWLVPYVKYSYRSIYHTKNFGRDFYCSEEEPLDVGNWQLICTSKECTEIKATCIVDSDGNGWQDYHKEGIPSCYPFTSSLESFRSLLTSKNLDVNKNYILIKKLP